MGAIGVDQGGGQGSSIREGLTYVFRNKLVIWDKDDLANAFFICFVVVVNTILPDFFYCFTQKTNPP